MKCVDVKTISWFMDVCLERWSEFGFENLEQTQLNSLVNHKKKNEKMSKCQNRTLWVPKKLWPPPSWRFRDALTPVTWFMDDPLVTRWDIKICLNQFHLIFRQHSTIFIPQFNFSKLNYYYYCCAEKPSFLISKRESLSRGYLPVLSASFESPWQSKRSKDF